MPKKIELKMIENGFDFILKSFEDIENNDLKYTALHLYSGVLLVLKERLYKEDKSLIFENVERYNENNLKNGDFQSVRYKTLLKRLDEIEAGISKEFKEKLDWLNNERNKMEHFQVNISIDALKSHIVNILVHLVSYIKKELVYNDFLDESDDKLQEISEYLNDYQEYVNLKLSQIYEQTEVKEQIIEGLECPSCLKETVVLEDDSGAYCHFCEKLFVNFRDEYFNAHYSLYSIIKDGDPDPRLDCVECEYDSMFYLELSDLYVCFTCGCSYKGKEITFCARCENQIVFNRYPDEPAFCDFCIEELRSW